jgi:hypothetical protein
MPRYLQLKAGRVFNVISVDDPTQFPEMTLVLSPRAGDIGDVWDGQAATTPAELLAARQAAAAVLALDAALAAEVAADNMLETIAGFNQQQYNAFFNQQVPVDDPAALRLAVKRMLRAMALLNRRTAPRPS